MDKYPFLQKAGSLFNDRHVTRIGDVTEAWAGQTIKGPALIGVPLSKSSISHSGACFAPGAIRRALGGISAYSAELREHVIDHLYDIGDIQIHVTDVVKSHEHIYRTIYDILTDQPDWVPVILGGDNSISYSTIKAIAETKGTTAVFQFDAHHDVRNTEDGGPTNGTPFRRLLDENIISGQNLIQLGIREFSNSLAYEQYVKERQADVHTMEMIREKGLLRTVQEVLPAVQKRADAIFISVDMDVLDQAHAPGCPAIGPGGLYTEELLQAVRYLAQEADISGIEIVEVDPTLDFRDMTSRAAAHVILHALKGFKLSR
ncbi:formimidoylglutamase [Bacillus velezensis]|uniref:formimidoylglutamase n=1 Tax=Bacillus velezensis TaxID=492670 RepID=UPI00133176A0|nr:formimidoylglutamase [Bacillus velezensis]MEC3658748.1 formimidoylglutamase [Bacillus velezensis]MEC3684738.1 formimidoylglutamase [Bacillus velezensis]MEC3787689.1 formimidoylglutamase [Bacillus velezensis]